MVLMKRPGHLNSYRSNTHLFVTNFPAPSTGAWQKRALKRSHIRREYYAVCNLIRDCDDNWHLSSTGTTRNSKLRLSNSVYVPYPREQLFAMNTAPLHGRLTQKAGMGGA